MAQKLSLKDLPVNGKRVLMRVDFNVPLDDGKISDDTRIKAALPSIEYVLDQGASLILMSHLGRPDGKRVGELSLAPVAKHLSALLGKPVLFAKDNDQARDLASQLKPGQILLLENLRFQPGEEKGDPSFAGELAILGDVYVNDAFGTAHRSHASNVGVAKYFPSTAAAGFLIEKEIKFLGEAVLDPKRPFYALIGGAKVSSKLGIIKSLVKKADAILIGGGMAYTFLKAKGMAIGDSLCEDALLEPATIILEEAEIAKVPIFLPQDHVVVKGNEMRVCTSEEGIPEGFKGVDIGPQTIKTFSDELKKARTVFWNGPLGVFKETVSAEGTRAIAVLLATLPASTIIGGGDSIEAVNMAGVGNKMTHISTGGGASLEYIEFGTLPGIECLSNKNN